MKNKSQGSSFGSFGSMGSDEPALILNPCDYTLDPEANPELSRDRIVEENPYT